MGRVHVLFSPASLFSVVQPAALFLKGFLFVAKVAGDHPLEALAKSGYKSDIQ
jgi:hypothetical protein